MLDQPVICVADNQLGWARAHDRSGLALCLSERCADDSGVLAINRKLPSAAPVHLNSYGDFDDRDAQIEAGRDRAHESTSFSSLEVIVALNHGRAHPGTTRSLAVENHGLHDLRWWGDCFREPR